MKREFVLNILLLLVINLIIKPVYLFGVEARIQNLVGTAEYGLYFDYFNFVFLFQFLNDPGIQSWNAQFVPKVRSQIGYHFPKILLIKIALAVIFAIVTVSVSRIFGYADSRLILLISINLILSALFMYLRGTIAGLGFYRTDSLLSSLDKLIMIVLLGYLAWFSDYRDHFAIDALVYGQMTAYILACTVALVVIWPKISDKDWHITRAYIKEKIGQFLPYTLVIFLVAGYSRLDGVMLGRLLDDNNYQAGVYATAFRFYDAAGMVGYLFAGLLLPMYASSLKQRDVINELVWAGLRFITVVAVVIVCALSFYSLEFMKLLYDEANQSFADVLVVLMASFFMVAMAYIFGTLLVAGDRVRNMNYIYAAGLVLNFTLNYWLIPEYFALGAGVATLLTQILILAGQVYFAKRYFAVFIPLKYVFWILTYIGASVLIFGLIRHNINISWYWLLLCSISISLFLAFFMKIIHYNEIFRWVEGKSS
jgi:O-antigen/teichoic acid export membrane protein